MDEADPRALLDRLAAERGEDYAGLSRLIGRNPSYVQQYIKRGVPKRLPEAERRTLAAYFQVPESLLGAPGPVASSPRGALVPVVRHDVGASAGPGGAAIAEQGEPAYAFDRRLLRQMTGGRVEGLGVIRVQGESMLPTLRDGDDILVDGSVEGRRLRDGVYVLRIARDLVVKRIAVAPGGFAILSDNPAFPPWPPCAPDDIDVVGRVLWTARRIA